MNDMIERVAKAIYNNWANYPNCDVTKPWEWICTEREAQANDFIRKARAAIEAMREPTEEMLFVGSNDEAGFTHDNLLESWRLMIDEASK